MSAAAPVVVPFRARRSRRQAVAARLEAVAAGARSSTDDEQWASRLAEAVHDLGPTFASFALYLAARIDLLTAAECRELARVRTMTRQWSASRVMSLIAAELDAAASIVDLEPDPIAIAPGMQTHAARLRTGERLHVCVVTWDSEDAQQDLDLLPLLRTACRGHIQDALLTAAIADFRPRFALGQDCRQWLPLALAATEPQARHERHAVIVPRPRPELCSRRVLVSVLPDEADSPPVSHQTHQAHHNDGSLRLVTWWLRQAVSGAVFPVLPIGDILTCHVFTCDGRPISTGVLARLPDEARPHLIAYLLSLVRDRPDHAWSSLSRLLTPIEGAAAAEDVARVFRSLVPFRDDRSGDSGSEVADRAFVQWRAATTNGWLPAAGLVPFYQGLFACVSTAAVREGAARGGEPGRDVLADALRDLWLESSVRQIEDWSRGVDMMTAMEQQMGLLMQLPQKLDQLLTIAADGSVRVQLVAADDRASARRLKATGLVALLLVAAAAAMLAGAALPWSAWAGSAPALALLLAGGLLVWAVGRVL